MKRKQPVTKNLYQVPVLIEDTSLLSPELFNIIEFPTRLTAGKNILRLQGNILNLAENAPFDIEILDYNGDPIYNEITSYIGEDNTRVISIYIYPTTSPGDALITLLTEAKIFNGISIPAEWKGTYNAKWSRTTTVNPNLDNDSEIIFEKLPSIEIQENVGVQLNRIYSVGQQRSYNTGTVKYISLNNQPALILSGGTFSSDMVGGTVTVNSPTNPTPTPLYDFTAVPYTSTIKKILNTSSLLLDTEYKISSTHSIVPHIYSSFENSSYTIDYTETPTYNATENSESFALLKINNLQPATGDISRVKVYINNSGTVGTWEMVTDIELDETEIFVTNTASLTPDTAIGNIISQDIIDTYYVGYGVDSYSLNTLTTPLTYNNTVLNNSIYIKQDNHDKTILQTVTSGEFIEGSSYKIVLDAHGIGLNSKLEVYLSGSAFNTDYTDINNQLYSTMFGPKIFGKKIGTFNLSSTEKRYDDVILNFQADNTGTGKLIFLMDGDWFISDIKVRSDNDPGYTPNYTRIRTLIPTSHKSDVQLNFKVEYYNVAGVKSKQVNYVYDVPWQGGNRYIDGEYSMLTGSLYVADSLNSGIGISGYANTGFIRSLGYSGFDSGYPGFLLWSGSALSGQTSKGIAYSGVGLELYANANNYFRYSTRDSELDIRTDKIYIGNASTFISASNGNLQISSSKFSINAAGDVTASTAEFRGVSSADFYQWRNVTVLDTGGGVYNNISTYTFDDGTGLKSYNCLNLTGSYDKELNGFGPSIFTRINALPGGYPLAAIKIHPDSFSAGGSTVYRRWSGMCILEFPSITYLQTGTTIGESSGLEDANIGADSDDWYYSNLTSVVIGGNTYTNVIKIAAGSRLLLFQGVEDWRIFTTTKNFL